MIRRAANPALFLTLVVALVVAAFSIGGSLALFTDTDSVPGNTFTTGAWTSVQSGSQAMGTTPTTVTISAVDTSKAFVICYFRTNSSNASQAATCELTGATSLVITTGAANSATVVNWQVIEFAGGVTVQRGLSSLATTDTIKNIPITAVDTSKTFVIVTSRTTSTSQIIDEQRTMRAQLTSGVSLELSRNESGVATDVAWQVIQMDGASVQSGLTTIPSGSSSATATITAVDTASTFLVFNTRADAATNGVEAQHYVRGTMTNSTTLTFTRKSSTNTVDISWFTVSLGDGTSVQKGTLTAATTETSLNATITAINTNRTVAFVSANACQNPSCTDSTADQDSGSWTPTFTATTNLQVERGSAQDRPSDVDWFVVQFPSSTSAVTILDPWTTGTTHAVGSGSNRLLVFIAGMENGMAGGSPPAGDRDLTAVAYGGQSLTSAAEVVLCGGSPNSFCARTELWYLDEAGIQAATGSTFSVTWSGDPPYELEEYYTAVTLKNVDQSSPIGNSSTNSTTAANPIQTSSTLVVGAGDLVVVSAFAGTAGSYTPGSGYTAGTDQSALSATMASAYRAIAADGTEQPSMQFDLTINRQVILAAVINVAP